MFTYAGNIHIHSSYSDGSGSIEEIAKAAAKAGLDYIVITDHETMLGRREEGRYGKVVVLVGVELNRRANHYLALNLDRVVAGDEEDPQQMIDQVARRGGFGFLAHPFERGSPFIGRGAAFPWDRWPVFRFQGIELWNYSSQWRGSCQSLPRALFHYFFNRNAPFRQGPPPDALRLWDCYTRRQRVAAIGGSDAHASIVPLLGPFSLVIFPYPFIFRTINTYVVLEAPLEDDFSRAREQILRALREGSCYISYDRLHPGRGFRFEVRKGSLPYAMGSELPFQEGLSLHLESPAGKRSLLRLIKDGKLVFQGRQQSLHYPVTAPGVYRAEVFYRPGCGRSPRPWIYSNPIYIRGASVGSGLEL